VEQVTMPQAPMLLSLVNLLVPIGANYHWKSQNILDVKVALLHEHLRIEEVLSLNALLNFVLSFLI
jgi:hypothetical protein